MPANLEELTLTDEVVVKMEEGEPIVWMSSSTKPIFVTADRYLEIVFDTMVRTAKKIDFGKETKKDKSEFLKAVACLPVAFQIFDTLRINREEITEKKINQHIERIAEENQKTVLELSNGIALIQKELDLYKWLYAGLTTFLLGVVVTELWDRIKRKKRMPKKQDG